MINEKIFNLPYVFKNQQDKIRLVPISPNNFTFEVSHYIIYI